MATYYFRNSNGNWNSAASWSITDGGPANGAVPTSADDAYFTSNSGNCTVNAAGMVSKTLIFSGVGAGNYANTFTLTNTLTVSGNVTLSSTMTFAGTSTLTINAASTLTSNGKTMTCSLNYSALSVTLTLADNVTINGSFGISNGTITGNTLYVGGSFTQLASGIITTINSNIELNGTGNLTTTSGGSNLSGTGTITVNTTGTITVTGLILSCTSGSSRSFVYTAGNLLFTGTFIVLSIGAGTLVYLDLKGVPIASSAVSLGTQNGTINLVSDLVINGGVFSFGSTAISGSQAFVLNSSGGALYLGGSSVTSSVTSASTVPSITGTARIVTSGGGFGTWSVAIAVSNNLTFNHSGTIRILQNTFGQTGLLLTTGGTYTYRSGRFDSTDRFGSIGKGSINITGSCTLIGFNQLIGIGTYLITNGVTLTMDKFFCGSPSVITNVTCATATGSYTITFQDSLEKIAYGVRVSNCTLSQRGQLLVLNQKANSGRNVGVRYQNVWPNSVGKFQQNVSAPFAGNQMTFGAGGVMADPAYSI
jgi:fibronectin-binding autotransporter adhesin